MSSSYMNAAQSGFSICHDTSGGNQCGGGIFIKTVFDNVGISPRPRLLSLSFDPGLRAQK
jgi:hypothetical protein